MEFIYQNGLKKYLILKRGLTNPLFFCIITTVIYSLMDKEKLKLILRNMELLLDSLKAEILSDETYKVSEIISLEDDYDEVFEG